MSTPHSAARAMFSARLLLAGSLLLAHTPDASANGINPPRLKATTPVAASCSQKANGQEQEREILRARVRTSAGPVDVLKIRVDDADEEIGLAAIESLVMGDGPPDHQGYASAKLVGRGDAAETAALVQVRSRGGPVRLSGFSRDGASVAVELARCARVTFSAAGEPEPERSRGTPKK